MSFAAMERESRAQLDANNQVREVALKRSRELTRLSATSIRAAHRREFAEAESILAEARAIVGELEREVASHPDIYYAGYVQDAHKEFVEANLVLCFVHGKDIPSFREIGVAAAAYLNGLGEAASELRRFILDSLRRNDYSRCEELLTAMDDVYGLLVTLDYPDALTGGLRRTTDMLRGVLERTRGDLTLSMRERSLNDTLERLEARLDKLETAES